MKPVLTLLALAPFGWAVCQLSASDVISALNAADKKFESFSIAGAVDLPLSIAHPDQGRNLADIRLTSQPSGFACSIVSTKMIGGPHHVPPSTTGYGQPFREHDDDGNLVLPRLLSQWTLSLPSLNAWREDTQPIVVKSDGTIDEKIPYSSIEQADLQSPLYHYPFDQACMATGRGFTRLVSEVTSVTNLQGGLLRAVASGKDRLGQTGTWILDLDPSREYLAVGGKFYIGAITGEPAYTFATRGELRNEDGFSIAAEGDVEIPMGSPKLVKRYRFATFSKQTATAWIVDAQSKLNERSERITYKDRRTQ